MKYRHFRPAGLTLAGLGLLAVLGACETSSGYKAAPVAGASQPIAIAARPEPEEEGPKVNEWGGIIPEAQPSTPVDDGGLGEIGS